MLIRLTLGLGIGLLGSMFIIGDDNSDVQLGLARAVPLAQIVAPDVAVQPLARATVKSAPVFENQTEITLTAFVPPTPVMVGVETQEFTKQSLESTVKHGRIGAQTANVRQGPGKTFPVISQLGKGHDLVILSQLDGWSLISAKDGSVHGYVATRLLDL
jgi:hypothetical protein